MADRTQKTAANATFGIHQIVPVSGWQAVYWDKQEEQHFCIPIYALALVTRTERDAHTAMPRRDPYTEHYTPEEHREVVGMEYTDCGFSVCDETSNFCGLLPPDRTLVDFERDQCFHVAARAQAHNAEAG